MEVIALCKRFFKKMQCFELDKNMTTQYIVVSMYSKKKKR